MHHCLVCRSRFAVHVSMCSYCCSSHSLALVPERVRAAIDSEVELTTARDLARTQWEPAELPAFPGVVIRRGAFVVMFGSAGSGKSTMLVRGLDSLPGTSLLISVEEPAGPSLAERMARVGAKDDRLLVCSRATVDQIAAIVRKRKVMALGVDSVQRAMFEPRDLRHLLQVLPSLTMVIAISQINRNGDVRGGQELAHEADVVLELDALKWTIRKSRYQPIGASGPVLSAQMPKEEDNVSA